MNTGLEIVRSPHTRLWGHGLVERKPARSVTAARRPAPALAGDERRLLEQAQLSRAAQEQLLGCLGAVKSVFAGATVESITRLPRR